MNAFARRIELGLCVDCVGDLDEDDGIRCLKCVKKKREYYNRKSRERIAHGDCIIASCVNKAIRGRKKCSEHFAIQKEKEKLKIKEKHSAGICDESGCNHISRPNRRKCQFHSRSEK